jgi:ribosomal protein L7/L12
LRDGECRPTSRLEQQIALSACRLVVSRCGRSLTTLHPPGERLMPLDFGCEHCGLDFSVGWYHYHSADTSYGSSTLAVCEHCGTQHRIEQALDFSDRPAVALSFDVMIAEVPPTARVAVTSHLRKVRGLPPTDAFDLVNAPPILLGRELRESRAREVRSEYEALGAIVDLVEKRRELLPATPPQERDRLFVRGDDASECGVVWRQLEIRGPVTGLTGVFKLDHQACGRCSALGRLVTEWTHTSRPCPRCHYPIQEKGRWVT